jgi:serine/threonine-protein kinase RsbW
MQTATVQSNSDIWMLKFDIPSGPSAVRDALDRLTQGLNQLPLDAEEQSSIQLVLAEALNNIMEHAFAPPTPAGHIAIEGTCHDDGLHFVISDTGSAMPDGQLPLGESQDLDVDLMDLPEGGFGWFMIREIAKDLNYERCDGVNTLNLRVAVVPSD